MHSPDIATPLAKVLCRFCLGRNALPVDTQDVFAVRYSFLYKSSVVDSRVQIRSEWAYLVWRQLKNTVFITTLRHVSQIPFGQSAASLGLLLKTVQDFGTNQEGNGFHVVMWKYLQGDVGFWGNGGLRKSNGLMSSRFIEAAPHRDYRFC